MFGFRITTMRRERLVLVLPEGRGPATRAGALTLHPETRPGLSGPGGLAGSVHRARLRSQYARRLAAELSIGHARTCGQSDRAAEITAEIGDAIRATGYAGPMVTDADSRELQAVSPGYIDSPETCGDGYDA